MDQELRSRSRAMVLDEFASRLVTLLWKTSSKVKELQGLVEEESRLLGCSTASTIALVLKKQEEVQATADKCLLFVESRGVSSGASDRIRSLTVSIRNADLRRQAAKSAFPTLDKRVPLLSEIDPLPPFLRPVEKERCASLDRKVHRSKSTPVLHSIRATSTKSIPEVVCPYIPQTSNRSRAKGASQKVERGCRRSPCKPYLIPTASESQLEGSARSQAAEMRLDSIVTGTPTSPGHPGLSVTQRAFQDYRHPPQPPALQEEMDNIIPAPQLPHSRQWALNGSGDGEERTSPMSPIPIPSPTGRSERFSPFRMKAPASVPPINLNEVTKSFDTEDVLKYTQKKIGAFPGTCPKASVRCTTMSNYTEDGEKDESYFLLHDGSSRDSRTNQAREMGNPPIPRPLEPSPSTSFHDLSRPSPNLAFSQQATGTEVGDLKSREMQRRLTNFRLRTPIENGQRWQDLARCLGEEELDLLMEALAFDHELLRMEERQCLIYTRLLRREPEDHPPTLPPKQKGGNVVGAYEDPEEETTWEGIKPTLV